MASVCLAKERGKKTIKELELKRARASGRYAVEVCNRGFASRASVQERCARDFDEGGDRGTRMRERG